MATELNIKVTEKVSADKVNFYELTGTYNAVSNLTGWGAPNEATTDAVTATVTFKSPAGTSYTAIDVLASSFPNVDSTYSVQILATDLGLTKFADGLWEVTYAVTTGTTTYSVTQSLFFYAQVKQIVCDLVADVDINECCSNAAALNTALQAQAYLCAIQYAIGCGNLTGAAEILSTLQRLVDCSTC